MKGKHNPAYHNVQLFITESKQLYGDSKFNYENICELNSCSQKINLVCNDCGHEFMQSASAHLNGRGCPYCNKLVKIQKLSKQPNDIISIFRSRRLDGGKKYDYSRVKYVNMHTKVEIGCPLHGFFWQTPLNHIQNHDCPICGKNRTIMKRSHSWAEYYDRLKIKRSDGASVYDYSRAKYVNLNTPIEIVCKKHGPFWQSPRDHIKGCGCPICKSSQLEMRVASELSTLNIRFKQQVKFSWLGRQSLDFYLPDYNIAIECQGIQHYKETAIFGPLQHIKDMDRKKRQLCYRNGVNLYYIKYDAKIDNRIQKILTKQNKSTPNLL